MGFRVGVEKPGFFENIGGDAKIFRRNPVSGLLATGELTHGSPKSTASIPFGV